MCEPQGIRIDNEHTLLRGIYQGYVCTADGCSIKNCVLFFKLHNFWVSSS